MPFVCGVMYTAEGGSANEIVYKYDNVFKINTNGTSESFRLAITLF